MTNESMTSGPMTRRSLWIALLLHQRWRGRGAVRALTLLPWALPTTMMALGWRWIFNTPYGPIEVLARSLGLNSLDLLSTPIDHLAGDRVCGCL